MLDAGRSFSVEVTELDNPFPGQSLDDHLRVSVQGQIVVEPFIATGEDFQRGGLLEALVALQRCYLVEFATGMPDAADAGHQREPADCTGVGCVVGATVDGQPRVDS